VKKLEALDHYFALMGVSRWQALQRKVPGPVATPPRTINRGADPTNGIGYRRSPRNRTY
jgi:hypothetical protein